MYSSYRSRKAYGEWDGTRVVCTPRSEDLKRHRSDCPIFIYYVVIRPCSWFPGLTACPAYILEILMRPLNPINELKWEPTVFFLTSAPSLSSSSSNGCYYSGWSQIQSPPQGSLDHPMYKGLPHPCQTNCSLSQNPTVVYSQPCPPYLRWYFSFICLLIDTCALHWNKAWWDQHPVWLTAASLEASRVACA